MKPYYDDGKGIVIYNGDASQMAEFVNEDLESVNLVVTDPPYKMTAKGGGIVKRRKYLADILNHIDAGFDMGILDTFKNWFCFCSKEQLSEMILLASKSDRWMLLTWNKTNPTPLCENTYLPDTEYILHRFESGRLFGDYKDKSRFIVYPVEKNDFEHPTVKPLTIISKLINIGSRRGDLILDPYCGTGTTLVSAKSLGRRAIGIEIEEKYCEIAARRLSQEVFNL